MFFVSYVSCRFHHLGRRISAAAVLGACLLASPAVSLVPSGLLEIHYINVQQGGSTLIVGPDGTTVLMDASDNGKGTNEVVPYLMSLGILPGDDLDHTLASHLDEDHYGGFDEVFDAGYDVAESNWFNGSDKDIPAVRNFIAAVTATSAGAPRPIPLGQTLDLGDGALLTVVAVNGEVIGAGGVAGAQRSENDRSVGVLIQYGDFDFIWAGDLGGGDDDTDCTERSTNQANLETPLAVEVTPGGSWPFLTSSGVEVMHVNHHGSASSTNSDYMNLLQPKVAVISVGSNGFEHPRRSVVENVLLSQADCVTAPPALVLQTEGGDMGGTDTSFAGYAVGDVKITTNGSTYLIEATGEVSRGPDERNEAGLPAEFLVNETGSCASNDTTMCLNGNRFQVELDWRSSGGNTGVGRVVPAGSEDSGLFWFFHPENWEMLLKVLDGCNQNGHFWVFAAATTNVEYTLRITDTETGTLKEYFNPQGRSAPAVTDTRAFATCEDEPGQPTADFTRQCTGFRCRFSDLSSDSDGFLLSWAWEFGDGDTSSGRNPDHEYPGRGSYAASLRVTDNDGKSGSKQETVRIVCPTCCRVCTSGKACGDSCISVTRSCSQPPGCACNAREVCG